VVQYVSSSAVKVRLSSHRVLLLVSSRVDRGALVAGLRGTLLIRGVVVLEGALKLVVAPFGSVAAWMVTSTAAASEQGAAVLGARLVWWHEGTALTSWLHAGVLQVWWVTLACLGVALLLIVLGAVSVVASRAGSLTMAQSRGLQGRVT